MANGNSLFAFVAGALTGAALMLVHGLRKILTGSKKGE